MTSPISASPPPSIPPPIPLSPDPSSIPISTTLSPIISSSVHFTPPAAVHTFVLIDAGLLYLEQLLALLQPSCQANTLQLMFYAYGNWSHAPISLGTVKLIGTPGMSNLAFGNSTGNGLSGGPTAQGVV